MNKIKYALGMLATGVMAGAATQAAAAKPIYVFTPPADDVSADHTQPFFFSFNLGSDILGDPIPIFTYHGDGSSNHLTTGSKIFFGDLAHFNSQVFYTDALPTLGETFDQTDITTWTNTPETPADPWYHVEFVVPDFSGSGLPTSRRYLGTIQINGDGSGHQELDEIRYTELGVPEPAAWTLMILGFGATGAALRGRRRALAA